MEILLIKITIAIFIYVVVCACFYYYMQTVDSKINIAEKKIKTAEFFKANPGNLTKKELTTNEDWLNEGLAEKKAAQNEYDFLRKVKYFFLLSKLYSQPKSPAL